MILSGDTNMRKETKSKIHKATVCPMMTHALETRAEHKNKIRKVLKANEMKMPRKIGKNKNR